MMRGMGMLMLVVGLIGCNRQLPTADLNDLTKMVGCALPADTVLVGGRQSDTGAYWFVQSPHPLSLSTNHAPSDSPLAEADIPAGVLTGLLKQHDRLADLPAAESVPGRLREWDRPDGLLRIREFQTKSGWYTVIEFSPTPSE